jgi:hypothetical protein
MPGTRGLAPDLFELAPGYAFDDDARDGVIG